MKTKLVTVESFVKHPHPASKLFRSIELKKVYEMTKNIEFRHPSIDIGCGDGYLSSLLFDEPFTYGIDNGEANDVDIAIKEKRYDHVLVESAEKMSLKNNSLNFAFSNSVLEHIPNIEAVLSEVSRTLTPGGDFVFTSPSDKFGDYLYVTHLFNKMKLGFLANWYSKKRNKLLNHYHVYSHTKWEKLLQSHGFKVVKYAYYIDNKTLQIWDKIVIEVLLKRRFVKNAEDEVFQKYHSLITQLYTKDNVSGAQGASLFIHSKKI